jgi:hypothetical protein
MASCNEHVYRGRAVGSGQALDDLGVGKHE